MCYQTTVEPISPLSGARLEELPADYVLRMRAARESESAERRLSIRLASGSLAFLLAAIAFERLREPGAMSLLLYAASYCCGGFFAGRQALQELAERRVNVDLLMLAAAGGAAIVGEYPEGAILLFLFSLSGALERIISGKTKRSIEELMDLSPERANRVAADGSIEEVPADRLAPGDVVVVRPGERIPADGEVVDGETMVDQSIITGESMPILKEQHDLVFAGSLNQHGSIRARITRRSGESTIARIVMLVDRARATAPSRRRFTDWFGERYTLAVLAGTAFAAVCFIIVGIEPREAFYRAMTLLVVASPCAVVVAVPSAMLSAIARGARAGVLFKGGAAVDALADVRGMAFDKTGTLTKGTPVVVDVHAVPGRTESDVLAIAAAAESRSEHPIGRAIIAAAVERGTYVQPSEGLQAVVGRGIIVALPEGTAIVGTKELLAREGVPVPSAVEERLASWRSSGRTSVLVAMRGECIGAVGVADTLRPGAGDALARLRDLGVRELVMLTGDHEEVARSLAEPLGIAYSASLLPDGKVGRVEELRSRHGTVAMIGDGINDAPALTAADVGISLGRAGAAVTLESADVVLMSDDLRQLPKAVALCRAARRVVLQNLGIAFGVMVLLVLASLFSHLRLPIAVAGHEGSTVLVVLNGLRLLRHPMDGVAPTSGA